ncbi:MAG: ATP-dependent DNA helicase RecG [Firmicutes bacterium]|nr:ATP-dependent DNA helicase RecG [Bacillota bacterium]
MVKKAPLGARSPVSDMKGVGPKKAEALGRLGITDVRSLLSHFPRSYEDMRSARPISSLKDGDKALVKARVLLTSLGRGFGAKRTLRVLTEDDSGRMEVLFFKAGFMMKSFRAGEEYCFFGKVKNENGRVTMFHPSWSEASDAEAAGIVPVYPLVYGVSQKDLRKLMREALEVPGACPEELPESVLASEKLCGREYAVRNIHFPGDEDRFSEARYRLIFEELFDLRTALLLSKDRFGAGRKGRSIVSGGAERFIASLPFSLTKAQSRSVKEVTADMASDRAMNRLVQGDVGSGKTAVAEAALMQAVDAGLQGAFMAPTEILAGQHYESLKRDLGPLGARVVLLTGSMKASERNAALRAIADGSADVAVGTHALISEGVSFRDLGLVITDEQHRFGVNQRKKLSEKGAEPDVLVMTATPIPRTLAVVLYGDLDVSVIDELPPGRKSIITRKYSESGRKEAYRLLLSEVRAGRQAYIVAPFIEDPESLDGRSAEQLYAEFRKAHPGISCALLHGAMKQSDKDSVMESFSSGDVSVLISTVVIEVGINVPNASVMLIENTERFGLAQLHQLRGRVGRGSDQAYCLLVLGGDSEIAEERADTLCSTSDGFVIAEKDLEMRGPGEFFGYRQHGLPQLRLADPVRHVKLVERAGRAAERLLSVDPELARPENAALRSRLDELFVNIDSITI